MEVALRWNHVPEEPVRSLDTQMWQILHISNSSRVVAARDHSVRLGLVIVAVSVPFVGSVAWAGAYILGLGIR